MLVSFQSSRNSNHRGESGGLLAPNASQLSALTRLFSSAVFKELATKGRSPLLARLLGQSDVLARCDSPATVGDAFNTAFGVLKIAGLRDEYIYRAALIHKILMGKHSFRTASILNEFRAGACKADLVILNGTATVYEIKSERDSLTRLLHQVENYKRVFATVNVITSEAHVETVLTMVPLDIGILCLSRRYQISVVRDAVDQPNRICPLTVFESLRTVEAAAILKALGVPIPDVPNTQRHAAMRACFAELLPVDVHREMVSTLKKTRNLAPLSELVDQLPESLHAAALSISVRRGDHRRLIDGVATPLSVAMGWA